MYSHASKMKFSRPPTRYAPSMEESSAPEMTVGSAPAARKISVVIEVVVLLPCMPASPTRCV